MRPLDDALGRCIRMARRVLGESPRTPQYIATVRGRGYRFMAPVQEQSHELPAVEVPTPVPAQHIPPPPFVADLEASQQPVTLPEAVVEPHPFPEISSPTALILSGEYKQVTICGGVVATASDLSRRLGPEAMHQVMQTMFGVLQQVMQQYGGTLIEFSGDGFLVLFGAPVAQEDHAQRAVLAALALHERLRETYEGQGRLPGKVPALGLGLHTGRVQVDWLGDDPQRLYTAAGETTQVALRLRQLAAPGTVLISAATQRLVHEEVESEPQGEIAVDNTQTPVPVYRVCGITRLRSGVMGHGRRVPTPFVGRERELALLFAHLDAAVAGQGQVVGLVGEPGMGKSRLLALYSGDPGVMCLGFLALTLWSLGYADQALARLYEAQTLAQEVAHPLMRANNLFHSAWFHLLRREATAARKAAEASAALSQDLGFAQVLALATYCRGAALTLQGQLDEGLAQMQQGLEAFRATGAEMHLTWHLSNLAWTYGQAGQVEAGWSVLVEALTLADERQEHFVRAWLYCIQGTLLLQRHPLDAQQAEACFQQAITVARRQEAKSLELRAAMSLARLWQQQGKHHEARELLAPIYGWFIEGFDTADLQEAKALLGV